MDPYTPLTHLLDAASATMHLIFGPRPWSNTVSCRCSMAKAASLALDIFMYATVYEHVSSVCANETHTTPSLQSNAQSTSFHPKTLQHLCEQPKNSMQPDCNPIATHTARRQLFPTAPCGFAPCNKRTSFVSKQLDVLYAAIWTKGFQKCFLLL